MKWNTASAIKLGDIADMRDYLENRCYCPGEIYDLTGFFFQVFRPDDDCMLLANCNRDVVHGKFVVCKPKGEYKPQIIYVEITDNQVDSCVRFDATQNNVDQVMKYTLGEINKLELDEYEDSSTAETLHDIFMYADAIMVS